MSNIDVVYPVKRQQENAELRYSLRSLSNLSHRKVIIAGYKPPFITNVHHLPVRPIGTKYQNSGLNIRTACARKSLSENFILMNDDFFVLKRMTEIPHLHRGDMDEFMEWFPHRGQYWKLIVKTRELLREEGIQKPFFYELHIPTVYNKHAYLELSERFAGRKFMARTVYHNLMRTGGEYRQDVKKYQLSDEITETDFLSTSDEYAQLDIFKDYIQSKFPRLSPYELY